jgi:hypothetical protein
LIEYLRTLPVACFIFGSPVGWLFLVLPGVVFYLRFRLQRPRSIPGAGFLCVLLGWALVLAWIFTTEKILWILADNGDSIPSHWEGFLFNDGARNVFALLFGWVYAVVVLLIWSPVLLFAAWLRKRQLAALRPASRS